MTLSHFSAEGNAAPASAAKASEPGHDEAAILAAVDAIAVELSRTAVERDRKGGHAARERELLRSSGLLELSIPRSLGGMGASWSTVYRSVRRLAEVDSALAHLFGFHHLQIASVQLFGSPAQQERLLHATLARKFFWGNALNPLDKRTLATSGASGSFRLSGSKGFSSGSVGSDMLTISAWHEPSQSALIGVIPTDREGVTVLPDWDAFGQKQTDSGTVNFQEVLLEAGEVLVAPGVVPSVRATLRSQVAQLVMTNLYLGIAIGAFNTARAYTREQARPWIASGVASAEEDPYIVQRFGDWWLMVRAATVLADEAALKIDRALERGLEVTAKERGDVALSGAEAKVLAHRAAMEISSQLFEVTGARSTSARLGLDRFWRNARVHTLHDPIDYKIRDVGRFQLSGNLPEPGPYS